MVRSPNRGSLHNVSTSAFSFDGAAVLRWARLATAGLRAQRSRMDDLNVFPVADSDTGTNLLLTFTDGAAALERLAASTSNLEAGPALVSLARGALRGARGSSGTILSQLLLGFAEEVASEETVDRDSFARALVSAADTAWEAVSEPVAGTILSVARACADAAVEYAGDASLSTAAVVARTVSSSREALIATQNQLPVLRRAGVVDAGGLGLVVLFDALLATVRGESDLPDLEHSMRAIPTEVASQPVEQELVPLTGPSVLQHHMEPDEHRVDGEFEVMFLVEDPSPTAGHELRRGLQQVGSSVVVVGGAGLWQVHVHCDDVLAALAVADGESRRQVTVHHLPTLVNRRERSDVGLVLCTRAPGLAGELARSGAVVVVTSGDEVPSVVQLSRAIVDVGASTVVVGVARAESLAAAEQVVAPPGLSIRVIPQCGEVQLLAAAAVHQFERTDDHDPRKAIDDAVKRVHAFQGVPQRSELEEILRSGELVTAVVGGEDLASSIEASQGLVSAAERSLADVSALCEDFDAELVVLYGGQEAPSFIIGVE